MSADLIGIVTSGDASDFLDTLDELKMSDLTGHMGELITHWQCDYICKELQYWISVWEEELAEDSESALREDPSRLEAVHAARTLIRFFKIPD